MTKSRNILPPRSRWTTEQLDVLRARYPHEKTSKIAADLCMSMNRVNSKASKLKLKKTDEYLASTDACRLRRDDNPGLAYRFSKGHVPANKGVKGVSYPGMEATQFKKGELSPRCKALYMPVGSHRFNKQDGYLERKWTNDLHGGMRWKAVHRLVWEEAHGPIPKGFCVRFKPGMKTVELNEITIDRLEMISLADNMRRNTIHNYPKEIVELVQLRSVIKRKINRRLKNERANDTTNK